MSSASPHDPVEAKRIQREAWDLSAAAWNRWWGVFESGAQVVNEALCDMARVSPGQRVLDLASGLGEPAFTAARRVGEMGSVLGVDLAPRMVAFARERATERAASNVRFEEGDGEDLRVEPASFDAALSRWGLMLMFEPVRGARSVQRALVTGGRFAAAVWSSAADVPFIAVPQGLAVRAGLVPAIDPNAPGPLRMGNEGMLERCLADAGFGSIESRVVPLTMSFDSPAQYIQFQREMSGTLKRALENQAPEVQARTWQQLELEIAPFVERTGRVRFENRCRLAAGVK